MPPRPEQRLLHHVLGPAAVAAGEADRVRPDRRRVAYGVGAYLVWGVLPLFWPLLKPAGSIEILAHRFVWSLGVVLVILTVQGRWAWIGELVAQPRRIGLLVAAAVLIAINWG